MEAEDADIAAAMRDRSCDLDPPVVDALSMLLVRKWLEVDRFSEEEEEVENSGTLTSGVIASS